MEGESVGYVSQQLKWYERLDKELITLGYVCSTLDTACYIYIEEGQLAGIACFYVDDVIVVRYFRMTSRCGTISHGFDGWGS